MGNVVGADLDLYRVCGVQVIDHCSVRPKLVQHVRGRVATD